MKLHDGDLLVGHTLAVDADLPMGQMTFERLAPRTVRV
jgi:hypothetical protein